MYPLFESIKVVDGKLHNTDWHQMRYERSYKMCYEKNPLSPLTSQINIPLAKSTGVYKLRISYNERYKKIELDPYKIKEIKTLKVVVNNEINYSLKYSDRSSLLKVYEQKESCDDVLIIKEGKVTDTSYANIVFYNGQEWLTPSTPLLEGTARANLLNEGIIIEQDIHLEDLASFKSFKVINALRSFDEVLQSDISNIKL